MPSISNVSIKNFRTYRDAEVDFDESTGVYLLSGDNGAGKSTFLNAINWCLYGDTPFFSIVRQNTIVSDGAADDEEASVQLFITINDSEYSFRRTARKNGPTQGNLVVQVENDGNWTKLNSVEAEDAVRRVLPREIRHLFFFNGEQLRDIYTNDGKEHNLKDNVYKVSEIDVLDNAISHLKLLEDKYLRRINRTNKNADQIARIQQNINSSSAVLQSYTESIQHYREKLSEYTQKINDLDALLRDTKDARLLIEKRDNALKQIESLDEQIQKETENNRELIREYLPAALLHDKFREYYEALQDAKDNFRIPPPIDPVITQQILVTGRCICGVELSAESRALIERQNKEYNERKELQHLTDGILQYEKMDTRLPSLRYSFEDIQSNLIKLKSERERFSVELSKINEQLARFDIDNMPENPELSRENYEQAKEKTRIKLQAALDAENETRHTLNESRTELNKLIAKDCSTQKDEELRQRTIYLGEKISEIKHNMEEITREKLREQTWETFSRILPGNEYDGLIIDDAYNISLSSQDGKSRSVSMASTGEVKALGLSLVSALSDRLGYADAPLLVDNLYGDLSESHFNELTKMVSILARKKQVIIMNLDIERVESEFDSEIVKGRYQIIKNPISGTEISRYIINE